MGSFLWDEEYNSMCYSQHHNGRPLSVVLTEPFDPFEPQPASFFDDIPYIESDFATLHHHHHHHHNHNHHHQQQQLQQQHQRHHHHHHHHHHHEQQHQRSRSSGRKYKRECYSVRYPNSNCNCNSYYSPPPPLCRPINRTASREILVEKIETVTIEEQQRRPPPPPPPYMVSFVRAPSPTVRQVKIRPRPSSCFDLHRESTDIHQQQRENRWSKFVDERHEEHFEYSYNYKTPERVVPIEREPPPLPPKIIHHDAMTSTEDLYIPPPPLPPKQVRPETRDMGTTTTGLPKRPLCVTETQVIERFEKTEKVRHDSASSTDGMSGIIRSTRLKRPLSRFFDDDGFFEKQCHRASKKAQRKDFVQRMHARNGTLAKPCNSLHHYTAAERQREKSRVIVRPTSKPREILVDTSGIFGFPGEFSEPTTPELNINCSTTKSQSPFKPPDLI